MVFLGYVGTEYFGLRMSLNANHWTKLHGKKTQAECAGSLRLIQQSAHDTEGRQIGMCPTIAGRVVGLVVERKIRSSGESQTPSYAGRVTVST